MSGFFILRRPVFEAAVRGLSAQGYKLLVDIFASSPGPLAFKELAFTFRPRLHGENELDTLIALEYLQLLLDKLIGRVVPVRFIMFGAIGGLGLFIHLAVLAAALKLLGVGFAAGQGIATLAAMTGIFLLNKYPDLSRSPAARSEADLRPVLVLCRVQHRRRRQCRHRRLGLVRKLTRELGDGYLARWYSSTRHGRYGV